MENQDLFIRGDGSIWLLDSKSDEKITLIYCKEYAGLPITTEVKKKNADKMRLYEYMLASCENDDIFIRQDGGVYIKWGAVKYDSDDRWVTVIPLEPAGEIPDRQLDPEVKLESPKILENDYIMFSVKNNSTLSYETPYIYLSVYIDGEWYRVIQSASRTDELWYLPNERDMGVKLTCGGILDWIFLPPGHYRAELHNHGTYPPQIDNCFCVFEFDLERKNGEYSVKY